MPLLVDVAELEFPCFLDKRVWVGETDESWCFWIDLPCVAIVPFRPHVWFLAPGSFSLKLLLSLVECASIYVHAAAYIDMIVNIRYSNPYWYG